MLGDFSSSTKDFFSKLEVWNPEGIFPEKQYYTWYSGPGSIPGSQPSAIKICLMTVTLI